MSTLTAKPDDLIPPPNKLFVAADEVCAFMAASDWLFCIIGGLAVLRWGEPRFTQDADIALMTGFGGEAEYARSLLARFSGRIAKAFEFAVDNRALLLTASNGIHIDITFAALPFEADMLDRATLWECAPGCRLLTCSADDLLVMKLFASRPKDVMDAESIAIRQQGKLDWAYILRQLGPLAEAKGDTSILLLANRLKDGRGL